MSRQDDMTY